MLELTVLVLKRWMSLAGIPHFKSGTRIFIPSSINPHFNQLNTSQAGENALSPDGAPLSA
jgi:hypothetical protein